MTKLIIKKPDENSSINWLYKLLTIICFKQLYSLNLHNFKASLESDPIESDANGKMFHMTSKTSHASFIWHFSFEYIFLPDVTLKPKIPGWKSNVIFLFNVTLTV